MLVIEPPRPHDGAGAEDERSARRISIESEVMRRRTGPVIDPLSRSSVRDIHRRRGKIYSPVGRKPLLRSLFHSYPSRLVSVPPVPIAMEVFPQMRSCDMLAGIVMSSSVSRVVDREDRADKRILRCPGPINGVAE